MESLQDSWQDEFLSSAEYVLSPPISPAPPSPTLYSLNLSTVNNANKLRVDLQDYKSSIILPIQNDTIEGISLDAFNDVHQQHMDVSVSPFINGSSGESLLINGLDLPVISSVQIENIHHVSSANVPAAGELNNSYGLSSGMDDLFECDDEISGNLEELFEDLANAHVQLDDDFQPESPVELETDSGSNWSAMPKFVSTNNLPMANTLRDEFQQILQELGLTKDNIAAIPGVQLVFANELDELANEGEDLGLISGDDRMTEADDDQSNMSSAASSIGNDSPHSSFNEVIIVSDENETKLNLFMNDLSNSSNVVFISSPSTASSSDDEDDAQEMILDALIRGDIETAAGVSGVGPSSSSRQPRVSKNTKSPQPNTSTRGNSALVSQKLALLKPEKRGRKPSSAAAGKSWVHLTDKGLRKKEQNKTAATRYRQKKKMETLYSLEKEQELTTEFEQLLKDKEEIGKQIRMVKEILRELFSAKKKGQQQVGKRH